MVPGFQAVETYEVAIANLAPELERRPEPESVDQVLSWARQALATAEIAAICGLDRREAHSELARVASLERVGPDGFWSLPAGGERLAA